MRLIDADALICQIEERYVDAGIQVQTRRSGKAVHYGIALGLNRARNEIIKQPTIDAEPVRHGRWIRMDDTHTRWKCSECGFVEESPLFMRCHCGAKMDAKEETNAP